MIEFEEFVEVISEAADLQSSRLDVGYQVTSLNPARPGSFLAHLVLDGREYILALVPTNLEP